MIPADFAGCRDYETPISCADHARPIVTWLYDLIRTGRIGDFGNSLVQQGEAIVLRVHLHGGRWATKVLLHLLFEVPHRAAVYASLAAHPQHSMALTRVFGADALAVLGDLGLDWMR